MAFWVPIGSLFIFQGPYFQCFGLIHAKNVNLVCMYTTMSYLDLTVMSNDLHCYYMYIHIRSGLHCPKISISTYASRVKFRKSSWVLILAAGGPYWVSISQKNGSLLGPYLKDWGSLIVWPTVL